MGVNSAVQKRRNRKKSYAATHRKSYAAISFNCMGTSLAGEAEELSSLDGSDSTEDSDSDEDKQPGTPDAVVLEKPPSPTPSPPVRPASTEASPKRLQLQGEPQPHNGESTQARPISAQSNASASAALFDPYLD